MPRRWRRAASAGALAVLATGFAGHRVPFAVERPTAAAAARFAPDAEPSGSIAGGASASASPRAPDALGADADGDAVSAPAPRAELAGSDLAPPPTSVPPAELAVATVAAGGVRGRTAHRPRGFPTRGTGLDWEDVLGGIDGGLWGVGGSASGHGEPVRALSGIGFPELELVERLPPSRRRHWRPLVAWRDAAHADGAREPIPNVRCMGLSPAAVARRAARYEPLVLALAIEHGVSASLVNAVISVESCFNPNAVSPAGAIGLMQLMPATATWLGTDRPHEVRGNLDAGIRYLAALEKRFGERTLALAAYNAGPGNVRRYGGVPPFAETRAYVTKVLAHHRRYAATARFIGELAPAGTTAVIDLREEDVAAETSEQDASVAGTEGASGSG